MNVRLGSEPGTLILPDGRVVRQVEWREDDFYDSVQHAASITAGNSLEVFRDLSNKNLPATNLKTSRRIPAGSEFILSRVGVLIQQAFQNTVASDDDILKLAYAATLTFKINDRLVTEGPIVKYSSGLGMAGQTTRNNTGNVTTGVPSVAAAPTLLVAQTVGDDDDLNAQVEFKDNSWLAAGSLMPTLTNRNVVQIYLHGFIKKPQGK